MSWKVFYLPLYSKGAHEGLALCLVELTGEAVWPGVFYLWKVLDYEFNFFYIGSFGFSISCINFGNLCFPGTWHLL